MNGVDRKKLIPFGDKLVLLEVESDDEELIMMGGNVRARVVSVGPGLPYGRGEFYSPQATEGMIVYVPRKDWDEANSIQWGRNKLRILHERQCLAGEKEHP